MFASADFLGGGFDSSRVETWDGYERRTTYRIQGWRGILLMSSGSRGRCCGSRLSGARIDAQSLILYGWWFGYLRVSFGFYEIDCVEWSICSTQVLDMRW